MTHMERVRWAQAVGGLLGYVPVTAIWLGIASDLKTASPVPFWQLEVTMKLICEQRTTSAPHPTRLWYSNGGLHQEWCFSTSTSTVAGSRDLIPNNKTPSHPVFKPDAPSGPPLQHLSALLGSLSDGGPAHFATSLVKDVVSSDQESSVLGPR